jgi:hypothetical protein
MATDNPTSDDPIAAAVALSGIKMQAALPSGIVVVMSELTGKQELAAAIDAGESGDTPRGRMLHVWAQALRSLVSINGAPFDSSEHTPESFRNIFSARDFLFVVELFMLTNRPTEADVATFREGAKATV